jgi:nucleotide-binding universal stress UspA family protein
MTDRIRETRSTTPIRTIAVGFDGSPDGRRAVSWALDLARRIGADVVVVHAVGLLEHASDRELVAELEQEVRSLAGACRIDPDRVRWCAVDGDPCSALIRTATDPIAADLVVVGSHAGRVPIQGSSSAAPVTSWPSTRPSRS